MRKIYFLLYIIFTVSAVWSQTVADKKNEFSLDEYLNQLRTIATADSISYQELLNTYLLKARKEQNSEHLFNGYLLAAFHAKSPATMHRYADSLSGIAENTGSKSKIITAHQTRGTIYYIEKNYPKSLEQDLTTLQLIDQQQQPYEYYKTIYSIGLTYYYLQQYNEAHGYFKSARLYFQDITDYNHIRGYLNSLRYEALTACNLNNYEYSLQLIDKARNMLIHLRTEDKGLEKAYLDYAEGLNLYHLKSYNKSIKALNGALNEIIKNDDYANEHNIYYYLGLNYWAEDKKVQAINYFSKIDAVYSTKQYSNLEIKDAYTHLISYYKDQNNPEQALYYTNQLLKVTLFLQNEYRYLNKTLHQQLDIKPLEAEKERLEQSLRTRNNWLAAGVALGIAALVFFIYLLVKMRNREKEFAVQYKEFEKARTALKIQETQQPAATTVTPPTPIVAKPEPVVKNQSLIHNDTLNNLLTRLETFEKNHDFLSKEMNLNHLAALWHTNRTYLSSFINEYRGKNFIDYLHQLRIDYFLQKIDEDPIWKSYKISHIADLLGFSSARSFSNAFLKVAGMPPSFYIQKEKEKNKL